MQEDSLDKLAGVFVGGEKWNRRSGRYWHGQCPGVIRWRRAQAAAGEVGHVDPRHHVGGGQGDGADVVFDFGLAIEMIDIRESAMGY